MPAKSLKEKGPPRRVTTDPLLTVLNFSGGKQSTCLLEMVLRGDLERPNYLAVLNADPGMENSNTYDLVAKMKQRCEDAGVYFETVEGPNLYEDLVNNKQKSRLDNPPYWTKNPDTEKKGRLVQKCTQHYKIAPMNRAVRRLLYEWHGINPESRRPGQNVVERWIGFSADESHRVTRSDKVFEYFRFPLIEKGMTTSDVWAYFKKIGEPLPDRSVCNACFANGLRALREMYYNRPKDWEQAVRVDQAVRDLSHCGVRDGVYVNSTLLSLPVLAERDFQLDDSLEQEEHACDTGHCFI